MLFARFDEVRDAGDLLPTAVLSVDCKLTMNFNYPFSQFFSYDKIVSGVTSRSIFLLKRQVEY